MEELSNSTADLRENERVTLTLLVQKKEMHVSTNSKIRLEIVATDSNGSVVINFWDNLIEPMNKLIKEGGIYSFSGATRNFNGRIDISGLYTEEVIGDKAAYVPKYIITSDDIKAFDALINYLPEPNKQLVKALTGYNTNPELWNKFISIPVTERNHYNKIGGLFLKTLSITRLIGRIIKNYPANIVDNKRLVTKSLLHDIGKLDEFILDPTTLAVKKIEKNIGHNIIGAMKIMTCNDELKLFNAEEIDNIACGVMCHNGDLPIKNIEDDILCSANILDIKVFNSIEINKKMEKLKAVQL